MNFELTESQQRILEAARGLAATELAARAIETDRSGQFPRELFARMGERGLAGMAVPTVFDGAGLDALAAALVIEEISRHCPSLGLALAVHSMVVESMLNRFGTEEQKRKYLPALASGRALGAFALAEPETGAVLSSMRTVAVPTVDGGFLLKGSKAWVTGGVSADLFLVIASLEGQAREVAAFLVDRDAGGLRIGPATDGFGMRGSGLCEITLDGCRVGAENRLGAGVSGDRIVRWALDCGRVGLAAQSIGIGRGAFEETLAQAQKRGASGRPLSDQQAVQFKLADMATEIDAARLLVLRAACDIDTDSPSLALDAAVAKLMASEAASRAAGNGLQIFGGAGYARDCVIERFLRDSRAAEISERPPDVQKLAIAASLIE